MLYDVQATDAAFVNGRPPDNIEEVVAWARTQLGLNGQSRWRLISARRRFGKTLFEVEEETPTGNRRFIGKLGKTERAETLYRTLRLLRDNGFRPPSMFIVPEPIICVPERGFVLQEKAVGTQVSELTVPAAVDSARWLARLHQSRVEAPLATHNGEIHRWAHELSAALPDQHDRIDAIHQALCRLAEERSTGLVPCHGDFHPLNIFISDETCITGIDLDKFCRREAEFDAGFFLAQSAAFGFFETASFASTTAARMAFLEAYEFHSGMMLDGRRTAMYMAMAFLKNLHFEAVLLGKGRTEHAEPWLWAAAAALLDHNLYLAS